VEISKIEVFECHKCGAISKAQEDITKCLEKHRTQELKAKEKAKFNAVANKAANYMVDNLTSFRGSEVQAHLIAAAKIFGLEIVFTRFDSGQPRKNYQNQLEITYSISGEMTKVGPSAFGGIPVPNDCSHYISEILQNKEPYFTDLLRSIVGLDIGSGGRGGGKFSYEIRLYLAKFPSLLEKYNESLDLSDKKALFQRRALELKTDYEKNRVPVLQISDIKYQDLLQTSNDLSQQFEELKEKFNIAKIKLADRAIELKDSDPNREAFITPEERFHYDSERLAQLKSELF
jgi:hypothetical protein